MKLHCFTNVDILISENDIDLIFILNQAINLDKEAFCSSKEKYNCKAIFNELNEALVLDSLVNIVERSSFRSVAFVYSWISCLRVCRLLESPTLPSTAISIQPSSEEAFYSSINCSSMPMLPSSNKYCDCLNCGYENGKV